MVAFAYSPVPLSARPYILQAYEANETLSEHNHGNGLEVYNYIVVCSL